MPMSVLALALLAACSGGDDPPSDTSLSVDGDADTDADADTDTDTDSDTDSDADTDVEDTSVEAEGWVLSGQLVLDAALPVPTGPVTAVLLDVADLNALTWTPTDVRFEAGELTPGAAMPFELLVDDVPPESLYHAPDPDDPAMEIAVHAVGLFVDEDGDGEPTPADTFIGVSSDFLIHVRGSVSDEADAIGLQLGWNELTDSILGGTVAIPFAGDHNISSMAGNLLPRPPASDLVVTVLAPLPGPAGTRRVDLFSFTGETLDSAEVAAGLPPADAVFPIPLLDPPLSQLVDDLGDGPIPGALVGLYQVFAYVDEDESGRFDGTEVPLASNDVVQPPDQRLVLYLHATSFDAAAYSMAFGGSLGWLLLMDDGQGYGDVILAPWADGVPIDAP